jgi:predicted nucleic acid-binding protein
VKFVVDANIVFSGILNTDGKIGDLLINSGKHFQFIAPDFLRAEIRKHHGKLVKISRMSMNEVLEAEFQVCKSITFISEEQVSITNWNTATSLVSEIDPNDATYVAFARQFKCKIWSGDSKLINGLARKGFKQFITTDSLYKLRLKK